MGLLRAMFVWWRGATAGTFLTTWLTGVAVGRDSFGNRYYRNRSDSRRWVLYRDVVDASKVPAAWHSWLHRRCDAPPADVTPRSWEQEHLPNLSGTPHAYYPPGSLARGAKRGRARGDYQAWSP